MLYILSMIFAKSLLEKLEKYLHCDYKNENFWVNRKKVKQKDFLSFNPNNKKQIYIILDTDELRLNDIPNTYCRSYYQAIGFLLYEQRKMEKKRYAPTFTVRYLLKRFYLWLKYKQAGKNIDEKMLFDIPEVLKNDHEKFVTLVNGWNIIVVLFDKDDYVQMQKFLNYYQKIIESKKLIFSENTIYNEIMNIYIETINKGIEVLRRCINP